MARGWESKSVESQMEDRQEGRQAWVDDTSRDRLELVRKRESLESSRRGVLCDLESTKSDLRRQQLEAALKHLENELDKIG